MKNKVTKSIEFDKMMMKNAFRREFLSKYKRPERKKVHVYSKTTRKDILKLGQAVLCYSMFALVIWVIWFSGS